MTLKKSRNNSIQSETIVLPTWSQGKWDNIEVKGAELTYRSLESVTTYHMSGIRSTAPGLFLAKVETVCGEQGYTCLHVFTAVFSAWLAGVWREMDYFPYYTFKYIYIEAKKIILISH